MSSLEAVLISAAAYYFPFVFVFRPMMLAGMDRRWRALVPVWNVSIYFRLSGINIWLILACLPVYWPLLLPIAGYLHARKMGLSGAVGAIVCIPPLFVLGIPLLALTGRSWTEIPDRAQLGMWSLKDILIATMVILLLLFTVSILITVPAVAAWGEDSAEALVANAVANLVWYASAVAAIFWFVRRRGATASDLGLRKPEISVSSLAGTIGVTILLMEATVITYSIVINALGLDFLKPSEQVPDDFYDHKFALAVLGFVVVLGAPIAEEIMFRGFLFGGVRTMVPVTAAALITGFLFSLAHYNLGLIIPFTVIGALLAMAYQRTGTLLAPMSAHFAFNLLSFLALVFIPDSR
jgi:membrane protease YdiL (CAAX protease family)